MRHTMAYRRPPGTVAPSSPVGSVAAAAVAATSRTGAEVATSRPGAATPGTFDVALGYKPVVVTRYQPMERKY
jgi:succinate dehydrogenase / fumarate reductase flavoprotein subunit